MDAGYGYNYDYAGAASTADPALGLFALVFSGTFLMIFLVLLIVYIIANWKIYMKAGEPGWGCIVPFYSNYLLFKIAWGNGWLFLLMLVPLVNIVVPFIMLYKLCAAFGYGIGFFLGMLFLSPIFILILAFGSAEYLGPA